MQDRIWVSRDGTRWLVSQMRTSHIINCLRMMDRARAKGISWRERYRERFEIELVIRSMEVRK